MFLEMLVISPPSFTLGGTHGKEPTCQYKRHHWISESGRSPGAGNH